MGMTKARRAREEAEKAVRDAKHEVDYQGRLAELDALVEAYDKAMQEWDGGMGDQRSRERMLMLSDQLHDDAWWTLMEFYRNNRR